MRSFVKIKLLRNGKITLSFIDKGHITNMSFNAIRENKVLAKISEFTVVSKHYSEQYFSCCVGRRV